jgi:hypothetical protein
MPDGVLSGLSQLNLWFWEPEMEIEYFRERRIISFQRDAARSARWKGEQIGEERGRFEGEQIGEERGRLEGEQIGEERGLLEGENKGKLEGVIWVFLATGSLDANQVQGIRGQFSKISVRMIWDAVPPCDSKTDELYEDLMRGLQAHGLINE